MNEVQTPVQSPAPPSQPSAAQQAKNRRKRMKTIRNIIIAVIVVAILFALGYFLFQSMKEEETAPGDVITDTVYTSSITSMVEGNGSIKARDSATVTAPSGGTVKDVFVAEGDLVYEGQPLFTIDSTDAEEAVAAAQKKVNDIQKELNKLYDAYNDLTIRAPHNGKLIEVGDFNVGDDAYSDQTVATLVDDTRLKLSLYYSYVYEGQITVGQEATVSIPATMGSETGTVTAVNYVRRVAPEGSILFHVEIEFKNPGTLTEGMSASASMTAADGSPIFAYETGNIEYSQTTKITTKVSGPILSVNLLNYKDVSQGDVLLSLGTEDNDLAIIAKEKELSEARDALTEAQTGFDNLNAVAPMSGTVLSCSLKPDTKVESGMGVTISDTTVMVVNANVGDRNIGYVQVGMTVDVTQWGTYYQGVVESISMEGTYENGTSVFPVVIRVDNPDGGLLSGMGVSYSFVASQSENCLVVPIQCVQYTIDPETGERISMVFIQSDVPPENTLELDENEFAVPEGFFPVKVVTGISDYSQVEIKEGLEEGQTVYVTTTNTQNSGYYY